jgi:hypothetical protein
VRAEPGGNQPSPRPASSSASQMRGARRAT